MACTQENFDRLMAKVNELQAEVSKLKKDKAVKVEQPNANQTGVHIIKDLTVSNLIKPWGGGTSDVAVEDFLAQVEKASDLGGWTDADKIKIIGLKLEGAALTFLNSNESLQSPTILYEEFKREFMNRFKSRQPDQFYYSQLQNAKQAKGETVQDFADRCKKLNLGTIRKVGDAGAQKIINEEAERRLLAAFTNGLSGNVGVQVMYRMPSTFAEALNHALSVSAVDKGKRINGEQVFATTSYPKQGQKSAPFTCYGCGKAGHMRRNCKTAGYDKPQAAETGQQPQQTPKTTPTCTYCKKKGHIKENCYSKKRADKAKAAPNETSSTHAPESNGN